LRRASASSGVPSHQSCARKPPALPEAAQATAVRSTTSTSAPRRARNKATDAPITPPPQTRTFISLPPAFRASFNLWLLPAGDGTAARASQPRSAPKGAADELLDLEQGEQPDADRDDDCAARQGKGLRVEHGLQRRR